jgi:FkbM family methyltransferase
MLLFNAPLHCLRKTKFFQRCLNSKLNNPIFYDLGYNHKVALRPLTHLSLIWRKKNLEPNIRNLIVFLIRQLDKKDNNGCFFDVGSNVGLYIWEVKRTSPSRTVFAFEPDPKNFELLTMTRNINNFYNLNLHSTALSNKNIKVSFSQDPITSATGCISGDEKSWIEQYLNGQSNQITVNSVTLDSVSYDKNYPSLIKIDVEGHEIEVLEGSNDTLNQSKPMLIIESFPPNQKKVIKLLTEKGFLVHDADHYCPVNALTQNLFAWHPDGPINEAIISKVIKA